MSLSHKLRELQIELPQTASAFGAYVPARRAGNLLFVSGQLPFKDGKLLATGPVPSRCSIELAQQAARQCVINGLAAALTAATEGEITCVARVGAFVCSDAGFTQQPTVANGASELLLALFNDHGRHARAAVGAIALPLDASVEIEFVFALRA